jgi:hypothetical protein
MGKVVMEEWRWLSCQPDGDERRRLFARHFTREPSASAAPIRKFPFFFVFLSLSLSVLIDYSMAGQKVTSKKSHFKPTPGKLKETSKITMEVAEQSAPDESDASEDDENSGVDKEGLEKLMNALGEDGLDEFDLAQLRTLTGSAAGEEESDEEEEPSSDGEEDNAEATSASEDGGQVEEEGKSSEIALDDEDVGSIDEDVIPRRKVEVDNKVSSLSPSPLFARQLILFHA